MGGLVLSLFPGIGLLDMAFEQEGYCVVRGPDVLWGGDVRRFHPPSGCHECSHRGVFVGVIGGPPCQTFSSIKALVEAKGYETRFGNLIPEFERVVTEARPEWFVMENVTGAPIPMVDEYQVHAQLLNNRWLGEEQNRTRRISFGTQDGRRLNLELAALESPLLASAITQWPVNNSTARRAALRRGTPAVTSKGTLLQPYQIAKAKERGENLKRQQYTLADALRLQGLPEDFLKDAPFTAAEKMRVVANGVPLAMGRAIARAVSRAMQRDEALA